MTRAMRRKIARRLRRETPPEVLAAMLEATEPRVCHDCGGSSDVGYGVVIAVARGDGTIRCRVVCGPCRRKAAA